MRATPYTQPETSLALWFQVSSFKGAPVRFVWFRAPQGTVHFGTRRHLVSAASRRIRHARRFATVRDFLANEAKEQRGEGVP